MPVGTPFYASVPTRLPDGTANQWTTVYYQIPPGVAGWNQVMIVFQNYPLAGTADFLVDDVSLYGTFP